MKLPFGLHPRHWGLSGKDRNIARAEYTLTGYDKAKRIAEIKFEDDPKALKDELLKIDLKYGKIDQKQFKIQQAKNTLAGLELDLALLEIEYQSSDMAEHEYQKQVANLKGEPFITIIESHYDPKQDINGLYFEFDWNDKWIELLASHGYTGFTQDQAVQRWFEALCKGIAAETIQDLPIPFNSQRVVQRVPRGNGTADYM